ncbi:Modifier of rudimentary family protein [Heterostelium album PN500]|uniref:Modifier of rudimentary family protein n=1 Tax=Heterostelium pallidum (strain ATCC 26659 / Pp 5 / PN500) TaxID=670386 RepID=D3B5N6_HETP5|nr:Modifier of rudimentary family protein [Heterostelium album PN500]EFA83184.1 Modifier of rudimentary family protein [Heterostelium album PN500]|eukprot:XP_020435301.1 Modifier of rudimentary family protein [Heterostelium album PN500]
MSNLLSLYPTIKELSKDSTYKIPLLGGNHIVISLPVNFPNLPPVYFLESPDGQTISVKPPAEWTQMTSLAKVTMEYIEYYSKNPPQFQHYSPPPSYFNNNNNNNNSNSGNSNSNNNVSNNSNSNNNIVSSQQGQPPPPYSSSSTSSSSSSLKQQDNKSASSNNNVQKPNIPSIPYKFPELESKSKEELEALLSSGEIEILMFSLDEVSAMGDHRDNLKTTNERLSTPINPKKEKIIELKSHLEEQTQLYNQLKSELDSKQKRRDEIQKALSTGVLIDKLTELASTAETESDDIANDFLEGTIDLKEFKKQFKEKRNIYHSRLAKRDGLIGGIVKDK